ncbi:MAG TPA: urate oxidase [Terriglobales bacterium]|nr:urate oxidase [Terriglobales bacterium]
MPVALAANQYGKSRVRLVKVARQGQHHEMTDLSIDITLSGEFADAYTAGDNRSVLPTDTMKNTVYALARKQPLGEVEEFCRRLADHFLTRNPQVAWTRIAATQNLWQRILVNGKPHEHAFLKAGGGCRTARITADRKRTEVRAGIADLTVLKTAGSAFEGYIHDEYTTLKETRDRLFGTIVTAEWLYQPGSHKFGSLWNSVRDTILEIFAGHDSRGVQHTLYAIGETILSRISEIVEIHLSMPNRHCLLVDLVPFGLDNPNEVFLPIDEPHGLIEATIRRTG